MKWMAVVFLTRAVKSYQDGGISMERISSCKKYKLRIFPIVLFLVCAPVLLHSVFGATFNLTAIWDGSTDPDIKDYRLYRTDGGRTLIGTTSHPNTSFPFALTVPDGSAGTLSFVLTAVDLTNNESGDSNLAEYNYDLSKITFSGYVRDSGGVGISGVVMGGLPNNPVTDANGYYSDAVSYGWTGTATPSKSGYTFTPVSRSYSNVTSNQTGQDYTGTISEVISTPKTPSGATSGYMGTSYKFSTSGSSSSLGSSHPVQYQFDWGDGTFSSWGSPSFNTYSQSHVWTLPGTYSVKAQARCKNHPSSVSAWSNFSSISVQGKPFIKVTSPNGGENLVVGNLYRITWSSAYLNPSGVVYLFYWCDGSWHPIATLSPGESSFNWNIPRIPGAVTSARPSTFVRSTSLWIGNWVNGKWECYDKNDYNFRLLYDGWLCKISGEDQGGATIILDDGIFGGYGISLELGMFSIEGTYGVDSQGKMSGAYAIYPFANPASVFYTGNVAGTVDSNSKKLTLSLTTLDGIPVFSLSGTRLPGEPTIPAQWVANLSGGASGSLTSLEIHSYRYGDELYSFVFEFLGFGSITEGNLIEIKGYFYLTSTTVSRFDKTNVYGIYEMTGAINESGGFTGTLNLSSGTISFALTSSDGYKYTLAGQKVTQ